MRKYLTLITFLFLALLSYSQKKQYNIWKQVKTIDCSANGIGPSLNVGSKSVKIGFAYSWQKSICNEYTYNSTMKIPKLNKGFHIAPDNNHYYFDGKRVYQVVDNTCGIKTWDANEFWLMMQSKQ